MHYSPGCLQVEGEGAVDRVRVVVIMWQNKGGKSVGLLPGRESFGPVFLMTVTPIFAIVMWHIMANLDGDVTLFTAEVKKVRRRMRQA